MSTSPTFPQDLEGTPGWKQEVNKRLAEHRTRRHTTDSAQAILPGMEQEAADARSRAAARVAARVAARYANAPSYSELLAHEARTVANAAHTAADAAHTAAHAAQQAHNAAQALLAGLDLEPLLPLTESAPLLEPAAPHKELPAPTESFLPEPPAQPAALPSPDQVRVTNLPPLPQNPVRSTANSRREPFQAELLEPTTVEAAEPIPANIIEFPRELVAPRKARPRLAEGPLREESQADSEQAQLRIFEAEPEEIARQPLEPQNNNAAPEWSGIRLDAPESPESDESRRKAAQRLLDPPIQSAPVSDRLMASLVDLSLVGLGFLGFAAVFAACTPHLPTGKVAIAGVSIALGMFWLVYQYLFLRFGESTPGMLYAQIALCTFDDENPSRNQARRRIPATLFSAAALGLGFLWVLFDEDQLCWHDRMTHTYQRSYK